MRSTSTLVRYVLLLAILLVGNHIKAQTVYALNNSNQLLKFDAADPTTILQTTSVSGLVAGQTLVGMDFRPATGELFALGYEPMSKFAQLYTINLSSAVATKVGLGISNLSLDGAVGFDFNPTVDRIRVVAQGNQNYRLNPITGGLAFTDGNLKYKAGDVNLGANPAVGSVAYTNSYIASTATTLYVYDDSLKTLSIQNPPNDGDLGSIAAIAMPMLDQENTDMDFYTNPSTGAQTNYFVGAIAGLSSLYTINLSDATITTVDEIGGGNTIIDIAVLIDRTAPTPVGDLAFGIATNNNLVSFYTGNPQFILAATAITGIPSGMTLVGSDFRPATGEYYALAYNTTSQVARVVVINPSTAAVSTVFDSIPSIDLAGKVTFDFNPTVDRIRVQTATGKSYRLNPNDGKLVIQDGNLNYIAGDVNFGATPNAITGAYTNSYIASTATALYVYDGTLNALSIQNPPNNGVLTTVGNSGIVANTATINTDMDIYVNAMSKVQTAYLAANTSSTFTTLYTLDLGTGAATAVGTIGLGLGVRDISVQINRVAPAPLGDMAYGITSNNNLVNFYTGTPDYILAAKAITGIPAGFNIVGSDFRPATGEYFALAYNATAFSAQVLVIDRNTAAVTTTFPALGGIDLTGKVTFDFNPTVDRIRVQTSAGKSYRLNPNNGALVAQDGNLNYAGTDVNAGATPNAVAGAYTNSFIAATATTLYVYDGSLNLLATQNPPNNGTLNTVGSSAITVNNTTVNSDMDIYFNPSTKVQTAFLSANTAAFNNLYTLDLATGAASLVGPIGFGIAVRDIAVLIDRTAPTPVGDLAYGITSTNNLVSFNTGTPEFILSATPITGIPAGMTLAGSDFRPATGELFALAYNATTQVARVLVINRNTAAVTTVFDSIANIDLSGKLTFDFNPTVDRIRLQTSNGRSFRLNPINGALAATDSLLNYAAADVNAGATPNAVTGAYTNSYIASTATTLYVYDGTLNVLTTQNPPNNGVLNTVGNSGLIVNTATVNTDMDIYFNPVTKIQTAFLSANTANAFNTLYTINLSTGLATPVAGIGLGLSVRDIAVFIDRTAPAPIGDLAYGITTNNNLIEFNTGNPEYIRSAKAITGIPTGMTLAGSDFRPATGQLYALAYNGTTQVARVVVIDRNTAAVSTVFDSIANINLSGKVTFDFNPTVDRIRVQTANRRSFRLNPNNGALAATDSLLNYAAADVNNGATPNAFTGAYTNSFIAASATTLYVYDGSLNILATQNPPNNGVLNTVGSSGIVANTTTINTDMDIYFNTQSRIETAFLSANTSTGFNTLYTLNLSNGMATPVAGIGLGISVRDIAVFIDRTAPPAIGDLAYGITTNNNLISFNTGNPEYIRTAVGITGIPAGMTLVGSDFRPATGELYAMAYNFTTQAARVLVINRTTGVVTTTFNPIANIDLTGKVTFDFNPTVDRIRLQTSNGKNFRLNPTNGAIAATDGDLNYAAADVNAGATPRAFTGAYTNSYIAATATTLYVYDGALNILATQNPPNNGVLNTVGNSGLLVNTSAVNTDMDIYFNQVTKTQTAYLSANTTNDFNMLYTVNLATGATSPIGRIGQNIAVRDIALLIENMTPPVASGELVYGVTTNNTLISFYSESPNFIRSAAAFVGLPAGYVIGGLDFRPVNGQAYAIAYNGTTQVARLYTANLTTGALTQVGDSIANIDLSGEISFDFNPTVDRIRVQTSNGKSYRLNPNNGALAATDGNLKYAVGDVNETQVPKAAAGAYTNSISSATLTGLYVYDFNLNVLSLQNPPNDGILNTIGISGITVNPAMPSVGMDIKFDTLNQTNMAYLSANTGSAAFDNFYTINLSNGVVTDLGSIGFGVALKDIAVFNAVLTPPAADGRLVYGITNNNNLVSFTTGNPQYIRSSAPITGLAAGFTLAATDFRPADGRLYGFAYNPATLTGRVYTVNTTTGVVTPVGVDTIANLVLTGEIDMDFNPTVDRIRLVSRGNNGNFRLNPNDGKLVATDGALAYAPADFNAGKKANIGAVAYTNSFFGTTTTTMFDIDDSLNILATQVPPNDGTLNTLGSTGIVVNAADRTIAMDIFYNKDLSSNEAYLAANTTNSFEALYTVNLTNGAVSEIGRIGAATALRDIAVMLDPRSVTVSEINKEAIPVALYPNPVANKAVIEFELLSNEATTVQVFDLTGKLIQDLSPAKIFVGLNQLEWNTNALSSGVYIVKIQSGNSSAVIRAVK